MKNKHTLIIMASLKCTAMDPDMQNMYDYFASQCGLGSYPPSPTHGRVSGKGNQFGSFIEQSEEKRRLKDHPGCWISSRSWIDPF